MYECVRVCVCARGSRLSVTVRCTDQPGEARARFVLNKRVVPAGVQPDPTGSPGARGWLTAARGLPGEGVSLHSRGAHPELASSKRQGRDQQGPRQSCAVRGGPCSPSAPGWSAGGAPGPFLPWASCGSLTVSASIPVFSSVLLPKNCSCTRQLRGFPSPSEMGKMREGLYLEPDLSSGHGAVF